MKKLMVMIMVMVMAAASVFAHPLDDKAREMAAANKPAIEFNLKQHEALRAEYNSVLEQYPEFTKWEHYDTVVETITFVDSVIAFDKQEISILDDIIENGYSAFESHQDEIESLQKREAELQKKQIKLQKKVDKLLKQIEKLNK